MSTTKPFWKQSWQIDAPAALLLAVLAFALIASSVVLILENRDLKRTLRFRTEPAYLSPGGAVPSLTGLDVLGNRLSFDFTGAPRKTVMLVFQPECGWCRKNMENWTALLEQADRERYRFLAVSTRPAGVAEYVGRYGRLAELPVIAEPDMDDRLALRLFDTPQTIVIDGSGLVEKIWLGAISGAKLQDVESYFGVSLPGIETPG